MPPQEGEWMGIKTKKIMKKLNIKNKSLKLEKGNISEDSLLGWSLDGHLIGDTYSLNLN